MENAKDEFRSIDEYIAAFPQEIQAILQAIRAAIGFTLTKKGLTSSSSKKSPHFKL